MKVVVTTQDYRDNALPVEHTFNGKDVHFDISNDRNILFIFENEKVIAAFRDWEVVRKVNNDTE